MTAAIPSEARFKPRNLLGVILFLRKYPGPVGLCLSLLLVNIAIEMVLPQIIGDTITNLRRAVTANVAFSPGFHVKLLVALVLVRAGVGFLLGPMAPTIALIAFYAGKLQPQWRNVHDLHGAMTTVIQENIAGVRVVKAFAKESAEIDKFRGKKAAFLNTLMHTVNYWAARVPFAQFIFGLSLPLVLWIGGRQVISGQLLLG